MKLLSIPLVIIGLVLAFALAGPLQERWQDSNAYARQAEQLQLERQALDLQTYQATQAGRIANDYAFRAMAVLLGLLAIAVAYDMYRQRRAPVLRVDGIPIARRLVEDGELVALLADKIRAAGVAQIEAARRPNVPHIFSPHISSHRADLALPELLDAPALASPAVPSFSSLIDSGRVGPDADGRNQPLILGFSDEGMIEGSWRDLYSSAAGGLQGSGKTWGTAFLLAQSAAAGARLVVCDPQAGDVESLANRVAPLRSAMLCDIADDDRTIGQALDLAYDILDRRDHGDADRRPVIVAIDEWLSLRRGKLADRLPELIEAFSTRGRKMNVHCLLMTQRADKAAIGDFRNTLASSYIYRMRPDEARMLTGLRAAQLPQDVLSLPPGACYLLDTRGQLRRVQIPHCTPLDIERVGGLLGTAQPSKVPSKVPSSDRPFGFATRQPEGSRKAATQGTEGRPGVAELSADVARIRALFVAGKSIPEIVKEIWKIDSNAGRAYIEKRAAVEQALRAALVAA